MSGTIGFIGIGAMGTPMAANLVRAGYELVIYDSDPRRTQAFSVALAGLLSTVTPTARPF